MNNGNDQKPAPSALLHDLMVKSDIEAATPAPAGVRITFDKIVFDLTGEHALKTTIVCRHTHSDGTINVQARSCTVEKKHSPMDVMTAIATGEIPPPWMWPHIEEGFV